MPFVIRAYPPLFNIFYSVLFLMSIEVRMGLKLFYWNWTKLFIKSSLYFLYYSCTNFINFPFYWSWFCCRSEILMNLRMLSREGKPGAFISILVLLDRLSLSI